MRLTAIEGVISGLQRTTQVSGGGDTHTSTTHICIFSLMGERVLLKTKSPAMIADGDLLRLAGVRGQGQFSAIACRNLSTGWTTTVPRQGCAISALIAFGVVTVVMTVMFPMFIIMPIFFGVIFFFVLRERSRQKEAHRLLEYF